MPKPRNVPFRQLPHKGNASDRAKSAERATNEATKRKTIMSIPVVAPKWQTAPKCETHKTGANPTGQEPGCFRSGGYADGQAESPRRERSKPAGLARVPCRFGQADRDGRAPNRTSSQQPRGMGGEQLANEDVCVDYEIVKLRGRHAAATF